jgi:hypothetical protein
MALLHGFLGRLHFGEAQIVYQNSDMMGLKKSKPNIPRAQFIAEPSDDWKQLFETTCL